ncbi:hypothetical protein CEY15_16225 [Dietzia natronolimnaea]|uniref:Uncharacterized protein n=1 Tax=Dietzia natronolimnaea TaxID=161920 RepID=A0A2A2WL69_9ACTN|nr:hypothetical protein [Dietzia natronolimnaea]PAY21921.1 hypothetical protein CEY15_16225 [Dietzia natronolimnaea]
MRPEQRQDLLGGVIGRTGHQLKASGTGQSAATGRSAALAATRAAVTAEPGAITMADLVDVDAAVASVEALRLSEVQ